MSMPARYVLTLKFAVAMALLAVALLFIVGCTTTDPHRKVKAADYGIPCVERVDRECESTSLIRSVVDHEYLLSVVEIDEQGVLQDTMQRDQLLQELKGKDDLYMIVFVHGWHHSAQPNDPDVIAFRKRLRFTKLRYPQKQVVGVYIGWRGASLDLPGLRYLTFWDRKEVSEEVGRNGLLPLLLQLESIKNKGNDNVLLLVGHSFGGSVLFNAVHQTMLQRLVQAPLGSQDIKGFGDLVVLINPAIESMRYAPFHDAIQERGRGPDAFNPQQPVLLLVAASVKDDAVTIAFRMGRTLSTMLEAHRDYKAPQYRMRTKEAVASQAEMDITAIGHYELHRTHKLDAEHSWVRALQKQGLSPKDEKVSYVCPTRDRGWLLKARERRGNVVAGEQWTSGNSRSEEKDGLPRLIKDPSGLMIEHQIGTHPANPYWIAETMGTVIPDHSSITQRHFWCFVDLVLQEGRGPLAKETPKPVAEPQDASDKVN